jgi:signal transduction histidine kinase
MLAQDHGHSPQTDEVATVAALLMVRDGASSGELAARLSELCAAVADPTSAITLLTRLAELGLVRTDRRRPDGPRYFLSPTGEQHVRATLAGQPELAIGLAGLEQLRTDLLSTVAHELRTPLTAVRTSIGVLLDPNAELQPDMRTNLLQTISHNAERMQRLVTDVLELTRYRMRGMQLQLRRFDAAALARDVAASFSPLVASRRQVIRLGHPDTADLGVRRPPQARAGNYEPGVERTQVYGRRWRDHAVGRVGECRRCVDGPRRGSWHRARGSSPPVRTVLQLPHRCCWTASGHRAWFAARARIRAVAWRAHRR